MATSSSSSSGSGAGLATALELDIQSSSSPGCESEVATTCCSRCLTADLVWSLDCEPVLENGLGWC